MQNIQFNKDQKDKTLEIRFRNPNNYSLSGYFCRHIPLIVIEGLKQRWKKLTRPKIPIVKDKWQTQIYIYIPMEIYK